MNSSGGDYLDFLSDSLKDLCPEEPRAIPVSQAIQEMGLTVANPKSDLERPIRVRAVHGPGLALTGFADNLPLGAVLHWGPSETRWLDANGSADWTALWAREPAALFVAGGNPPPAALITAATAAKVPVLCDARDANDAVRRWQLVLDDALAPSICLHGDLLVFCGLGIMIMGKSGIGKSDCALDLIAHGHQLVADDVVQLRRNGIGRLMGRGNGLIRHHMDIRGLGIVNVRDLFSVYAVLDEHTVDLLIYLEPWEEGRQYNFTEDESLDLLGVKIPLVRLPVTVGRNWENLIQVAVRRFILRGRGQDAEKALTDKLDGILKNK